MYDDDPFRKRSIGCYWSMKYAPRNKKISYTFVQEMSDICYYIMLQIAVFSVIAKAQLLQKLSFLNFRVRDRYRYRDCP